ncbi:MAG: hypothetical protein JWO42_1616 [Chloroflexi bacterium]|nr:hypothetical protein [Chloroflexota bacterium]
MPAPIVILGTLDTKGSETQYLRDKVAALGAQPLVVDAGILNAAAFEPEIDREAVAAAAGTTTHDLVSQGDRGQAVERMGRGAARIVADLHARGQLGGIIAIGGSGNATIAGLAMRALPIGVPKLIVSTVAAGDTRPYVGTADITLMYPIVDISGINRLSRQILTNAAGAIVGMVNAGASARDEEQLRPLIAATMFGVTTPCVTAAREELESLGYEVLVFHATGVGGRSMESLIRDGFITGVLDITTTELADEVAGGSLSAGPDRLEAAGAAGIPQVVSLGALDMANFGPLAGLPEQFRGRLLHQHNPSVTLMRTTPEENAVLGQLIAEKLNRARGPAALVIPLRGVSEISVEGAIFHSREADAALFQALRGYLDARVELIEVDAQINDPQFATTLVQTFHRLYTGGKEVAHDPAH